MREINSALAELDKAIAYFEEEELEHLDFGDDTAASYYGWAIMAMKERKGRLEGLLK